MKTIIKHSIWVVVLLFTVFSSSCEKLIEIPSSTDQIETIAVFQDSTTAASALLGAYYTMGTVHVTMKFMGLYADEYGSTSAASSINAEYANSQLLITNTTNSSFWGNLYSVIYQCNSVLEGLSGAANLTPTAKIRLSGEAKFLRAFANFYLVNFYDHIPLINSTNVDTNRRAIQASRNEIYAQMVEDLGDASKSLSPTYQGAGRVRANNYAAEALLARVYLYLENWQAAADHATKVIASTEYRLSSVKPEDVFLSGSIEAILQLWMNNGFLTDVASLIPASTTTLPVFVIRDNLYQAFESTDLRKAKWIGLNTVTSAGQPTIYPYPAKYKARSANPEKPEYVMALRLAEQYLIRAEARAQLKQISQSLDDVNIIRLRAGLAPLGKNIDQTACLQAIADERRIELFGEWGHRFLDLKRTGKLDKIIGDLKPSWKIGTSNALPIPNNEIIYNNNLKQNHGY